MFGAPVVEETPRIQYGATAFGLLGETISETSTTLFGQAEPLSSGARRERIPLVHDVMDPSFFTQDDPGSSHADAQRAHRTAERPQTNVLESADAVHKDSKGVSRHAQVQAVLESMNRPTTEIRPGSHLYDTLKQSKLGTLFGSVSDASTNGRPARAGLELSEAVLPVDAGLSSNARRLLQISEPLFPPGQTGSSASQSGGYYTAGASFGYYGLGIAAFQASSGL